MRENQRENILNAAKKIFSVSGYSATMSDIAIYANVSQGLAYRYFPNKEAIMNELADQAIRSTMETIESITKMPSSPMQRLDFFISKIVRNDDGLLEFFQIYQHHFDKPDKIRELFLEQQKMMQETLLMLITEGQKDSEIVKEEPEKLMYALIACLDGLTKFALLHPEKYKNLFTDASIIMRLLKP
jgi:AcrR family transcriptional regulator